MYFDATFHPKILPFMMKIYHSKNYLIEQFRKNKSYIEIAQENNVDSSTIQRYLRKYNLTKKSISWAKGEIKLLKENYHFNQDVHKLFPNRTMMSIYHKGNKLGLKREMRQRGYYVNKDFFKKWAPEMTYIFGLFCSDGHVSSKKDYCSIHLHSKDKHILEKIKEVMGSDYLIADTENASLFRIYNKILCADLINLGCPPRKSVTLKFPDVPDEYLSHFVRGFFDGDGSIHFNKPNTIKVSFIASKHFIETLQGKLSKFLGVKIGPLQRNFKMWICIYYSNDARKLCEWMYKNTKDLYLKRKKDRYLNHIELRKK